MGINLSCFPVGQRVTVQEISFGVQITPCGEGEAGLKIVEASPELLVLEDAADGSRKSIPMFLVHERAPMATPSPEAA